MRIEADRARGDDVTNLTTKYFDVSSDDRHKYGDAKESTSSTMANPGDELQCSVVDSNMLLPAVVSLDGIQKSVSEGEEVYGLNRRATEDSEEDSDSVTSRSIVSTSDELVSNMQNLRLRARSVDQCIEPLVSRGPTGGTSTRWNNDSTQFAGQTSVEPDRTAPNDVRFKRKIVCEYDPMINLQPQPVSMADTSFVSVFQTETDCEGWTGWGAQQQDQQATKFRRSGSDPQESDERAHKTHDDFSLTTASMSANFDDASDPGLSFDVDIERCFGEIGSGPFLGLNDHDDDALPLPQTYAPGIGELPLGHGTFLDQLEEVGPPPTNWLVDPNPEIALQRCQGNARHVASSIPAVTATVIGRDTMTLGHPSTHTSPSPADVIRSSSAAMKPCDSYVDILPFPGSDLPPPLRSAPAPSPSVDSGCFAASPRSSAHDLPPDVIFDYVEDKLRELVRYVLYVFFTSSPLRSDWSTSWQVAMRKDHP